MVMIRFLAMPGLLRAKARLIQSSDPWRCFSLEGIACSLRLRDRQCLHARACSFAHNYEGRPLGGVRLVRFTPVNESSIERPQGLSPADLGITSHLWTENVSALSLAGAQSPLAHTGRIRVSAPVVGLEYRCIVAPNVP